MVINPNIGDFIFRVPSSPVPYLMWYKIINIDVDNKIITVVYVGENAEYNLLKNTNPEHYYYDLRSADYDIAITDQE